MSSSPVSKVRPKLYVHIGMYKTGTTSIQYFLNANTDRLYDLGYLYPTSARHPRSYVQHHMLSEIFAQTGQAVGDFKLAARPDRNTTLAALHQEIAIADRPNVIVSSEMLCLMDEVNIRDFHEEFSNFDITPILFLRNYADLADSSYQTLVMTNSTVKPFSECGFDHWPEFQNVRQLCQAWAKHAKDGKIIIRNFDSPNSSDMVAVFAESIGLPMDKLVRFPEDKQSNKSLSPAEVFIKQYVTNAGANRTDAEALLRQLARLNIREKQTQVPEALRKKLNLLYVTHIEEILELKLASAEQFDIAGLQRKLDEPKIHIKNMTDVVFALGRAVVRMQQ